MNVLVIIPARGGSKGIPRKNLRSLGGKPLIYYIIKTALKSRYQPDVYVTSDDDEILSIASKLCAMPIKRDAGISNGATTLDPVIHNAYQTICRQEEGKPYDLIITLQPTSPLLQSQTLDKAIDIMAGDKSVETVIAAKNDTHLTWVKEGGKYAPNYAKRVNRQFLTPTFKETGAFLISRPRIITADNRVGNNVKLYLLEGGESIDVDTHEDWNLCEYYLRKKKILFVVSGNMEIGLGHVYNTLLIANDILDHHVFFLVDKGSDLAMKNIASKNYEVYLQKNASLVDDILEMTPDVVINDILDTNVTYVESLKKAGITVINFEDLGEGAKKADLVINALYPEDVSLPNHYFGASHFVLRDEFVLTTPKPFRASVQNVLLTFGGVDPNNLTAKVLRAIYPYCCHKNIEIDIVTGFGYSRFTTLEKFEKARIHKDTKTISDFMNAADIIFTSAGRTVYEVASIGVPAIVLAQNNREMTHFFASEKYGFEHLGLGNEIKEEDILQKFTALVEAPIRRKEMSISMRSMDVLSGRQRVQRLIRNTLENT